MWLQVGCLGWMSVSQELEPDPRTRQLLVRLESWEGQTFGLAWTCQFVGGSAAKLASASRVKTPRLLIPVRLRH